MATEIAGLEQIKSLHGIENPKIEEYKKLQEDSLAALQARYENPNWFNVAAGFLKPQLGGFAASLGSASQALGDWQEKQRANELTVAQQRAQLGLTKMVLGQRQKQASDAQYEIDRLGGERTAAGSAANLGAYSSDPTVVASAGAAALSAAQKQWLDDNTTNENLISAATTRGASPEELAPLIQRQQELQRNKPKNLAPVSSNVLIPPPKETSVPGKLNIDAETGRDKNTGVIPPALPLLVGNVSPATREVATNRAKALEGEAQKRLQELNLAVAPQSFAPVSNSLKILSTIPVDVLEAINDQLRDAGGLAAILQSGAKLGADVGSGRTNAASIGASGQANILAALQAKLPKSLRSWVDTIANNMAVVDKARAEGRIPGSYTSVGGVENTPDAFINSFRKDSILLHAAKELHDKVKTMIPYTHEQDLAPTHSIFESTPVRLLGKSTQSALDDEHATFTSVLQKRRQLENSVKKP